MSEHAEQVEDRPILRAADVQRLTGFSGMHIHRLEALGKFPKRFKLIEGGRAVGWLKTEVDAWLAVRSEKRATLTHQGRTAEGVIPSSGLDENSGRS